MAILHDQDNKEIFDCKFDNFQIAVCIITFRFIAYVKNSKYMFNRIILFVGGLANLSPRLFDSKNANGNKRQKGFI